MAQSKNLADITYDFFLIRSATGNATETGYNHSGFNIGYSTRGLPQHTVDRIKDGKPNPTFQFPYDKNEYDVLPILERNSNDNTVIRQQILLIPKKAGMNITNLREPAISGGIEFQTIMRYLLSWGLYIHSFNSDANINRFVLGYDRKNAKKP